MASTFWYSDGGYEGDSLIRWAQEKKKETISFLFLIYHRLLICFGQTRVKDMSTRTNFKAEVTEPTVWFLIYRLRMSSQYRVQSGSWKNFQGISLTLRWPFLFENLKEWYWLNNSMYPGAFHCPSDPSGHLPDLLWIWAVHSPNSSQGRWDFHHPHIYDLHHGRGDQVQART